MRQLQKVLERFHKVRQVRFKLTQPNDELDALAAVAAVEQSFRPMEPSRLEVIVSGPKGLNKGEVQRSVVEASEGQNTEIIIDGEDESGLILQADNEEFALNVPIEDPPKEDLALAEALNTEYEKLVLAGKVRRLPAPAHFLDRLQKLLGLI